MCFGQLFSETKNPPTSLNSEARGFFFYLPFSGAPSATLNAKLNVLPFPSSDATAIVPPIFSIISLTMKSPRPVPVMSFVLSVCTR